MPLTLHYVAYSHAGLLREGNEDSGYAGPYLLAIADGMGGHAAGEVASQAAIDELTQADRPPSDTESVAVLAAAVKAANDRLRQLVAENSAREGMGTTVTSLLWDGARITVGHIGDSRAYCLRDGTLTQITHDHTFVQSLVDDGRITPADAREHPARSIVTKVLQGQDVIEPDYALVEVEPGDRLLICSDGLSDYVSDTAIHATLGAMPMLDDVATGLIDLALSTGAPDNVTVVVADLVETDRPYQLDDTAEAFFVGAAGNNR